MGAHSTLRITKDAAKRYVMSQLFDMLNDDDKLVSIMDALLSDRLYNCRLVGDDEENNDDWIL